MTTQQAEPELEALVRFLMDHCGRSQRGRVSGPVQLRGGESFLDRMALPQDKDGIQLSGPDDPDGLMLFKQAGVSCGK